MVGVACVAGLIWERFWWWQDRQQAKVDACPGHRWIYFSLYDEGKMWNRKCDQCPAHEMSGPPHVGDRVKIGRRISRL